MTSKLNPYISFHNNCKAAMEFYHSVFGGDLKLTTFGESHSAQTPEEENNIMHGELTTPQGYAIMAADTPSHMAYKPGTNVNLSISGNDADTVKAIWEKLTVGAEIAVPLAPAPWGDTFGMCTDKFGIGWLINITQK